MSESAPADAAAEIARLSAAVSQFRAQAEANPDNLYPAQADALLSLGSLLSGQQRFDEGVAAVSEAVALFEEMARVEPDTFRVHLASAVNNLSNRLAEVGRDDEAAAAGRRAVAEARGAMGIQPDQARFVLVSALINQAGRRLRLGETAGAVAELASAVEAFRDGGESGTPFLGAMIEALHRAAMAFTELGLWADAIDTRRLMVDLFHDGAPPAVLHLLALTLQQAALALAAEGRTGDALACADEGMELARVLFRADGAAYQLFLAQALGNLAGRRHESGNQQGGLEMALEAVNLFHEAAQADPAAAVPSLILTLESLAAILASLGLGEQAATVIAQRDQLKDTLEQMVAAAG